MFAALAVVPAWGCGNVKFVDAPFAPRHIDVIYSVQEDVTAVRWRLAASDPDPDVSYELLDSDGHWQRVDFSSSVYLGGIARCGDKKGLCAQMVMNGRYQPPADVLTPVRSRNPTFDVSPGDQPAEHDYESTLTFTTYFSRNNLGLVTTINDVIGGDGIFPFPRPLERSVWDRRGVCVPGFFPSDAQFVPVTGYKDAWDAPSPLSDTGFYCAGVRAVKTNGDRGSDAQLAIDTVPEVINAPHTSTVPTETTQFSYQIVLDLSIPVADLCQTSMQDIPSVISAKLGKYSPLRPFPVIDMAATDPETMQPGIPCRQSPLRAIDAARVAQNVKTTAASWSEQHQRFFLLYFNNLKTPLPTSMTDSLTTFGEVMQTPPPIVDLQAQIWPFGPPQMRDSFPGWMDAPPLAWESARDPTFPALVEAFAQSHLPLISEIPDPKKAIPLLPDGDAQRLDGGLIRLCQVSITPLEDTGLQMVAHDSAGGIVPLPQSTEYPVHADDPPGYVMQLPPVWAVPPRAGSGTQVVWVRPREGRDDRARGAGRDVAAGRARGQRRGGGRGRGSGRGRGGGRGGEYEYGKRDGERGDGECQYGDQDEDRGRGEGIGVTGAGAQADG